MVTTKWNLGLLSSSLRNEEQVKFPEANFCKHRKGGSKYFPMGLGFLPPSFFLTPSSFSCTRKARTSWLASALSVKSCTRSDEHSAQKHGKNHSTREDNSRFYSQRLGSEWRKTTGKATRIGRHKIDRRSSRRPAH